MIHKAAKRLVQAPSEMWWVIAAAISPLFDRIAIMFTKIQAHNIVISQQRQEMSNWSLILPQVWTSASPPMRQWKGLIR
jgi:hypothetical protein